MNKFFIILLLILVSCKEETKPRRQHSNQEVVTEVVHDTIYIDKSTNLETSPNDRVDTTWKGTDKGWNVKDQGGTPSNEVDFYITCLGGYQYYIDGNLNLMSPRVTAGPSGYMMPMKCIPKE